MSNFRFSIFSLFSKKMLIVTYFGQLNMHNFDGVCIMNAVHTIMLTWCWCEWVCMVCVCVCGWGLWSFTPS